MSSLPTLAPHSTWNYVEHSTLPPDNVLVFAPHPGLPGRMVRRFEPTEPSLETVILEKFREFLGEKIETEKLFEEFWDQRAKRLGHLDLSKSSWAEIFVLGVKKP